MNNVGMVNAMAGPIGAGPMPMNMNNGAMPMGQQMPQQQQTQLSKSTLNTYIYDYFLKEGLYELARAMLNSDQHLNILQKDSPGRRREENGVGDDSMDTDSKDELDKRAGDLPAANLPGTSSDSCFLYDWFALFWDMLNGQRTKAGSNPQVGSYIHHTQQQNRLKQSQQQQDILRNMRPDMQFNPAMMRNMAPNGMPMAANSNTLARKAMANNQNNPNAMAMLQQQQAQQAKQNQMQRDPSDMDGNRRPASPGSGENAPSPSKRPRLDGNAPFNPQQAGGMMPNGRPPQQGMSGQQVGNGPVNFQNFANQPQNAQKTSIATYSQNLQQHHGNQMPTKGMATPGNPQGQGSPMMPQGPNATDINALYNANDFAPGPGGGLRPNAGPGQGGGSNHALQDYQMQLMLLEQQNKKRLMMARQEQDSMGGMQPRADGSAGPGGPGGPGGPAGPNGQPFPDASPQGARPGASPNPSEQMKRGTPQMNPAGIPSPLPEGAQSRGSPNPMAFIPGANMDPNMPGGPQFYKGMNDVNGNMMNAAHMNGAMRPPSSHPNPPFNGAQMTPQMMAARQGQGPQGAPNPQMQWQAGPNGAMMAPGPQGPVQGTPQQRAAQMPPPSGPAPGGNATNGRTQPSSPAQTSAAPPTPSQTAKAAPKKKDSKAAKSKAAAQKKANANAGATPAAESSQDAEPPTPATPITPANPGNFAKNGQNAGNAQPGQNVQASAPQAPAPVAPQAHQDPTAGFGMDNTGGMNMDFGTLDFANPMSSDNVLQDFDFDSFLHDGDAGDNFDFNPTTFDMQGTGEIATE